MKYFASFRLAVSEKLLERQVAKERRTVARANVRAGNYTNGTQMTPEDQAIYHHLSIGVVAILVFIALLVGGLIGATVS